MVEQSEKEFLALKSELGTVKSDISKKIGFIIGSNGVAFLVFSLSKGANSSIGVVLKPELVLIAEIVLIFAVYFLISYNFISHNRRVGYMQLLSQELRLYKIGSKQNSTALQEDGGYNKEVSQSIFSWDYVNCEWANRTQLTEYPSRQIKSLRMYFQLHNKQLSHEFSIYNRCGDLLKELLGFVSKGEKEGELEFNHNERQSMRIFTRNIIWGIFSQPIRLNRIQYLFSLHRLKDRRCLVDYAMDRLLRGKSIRSKSKYGQAKIFDQLYDLFFNRQKRNYYNKFVVTSWKYPVKVFALVSSLLLLTYVILFHYYFLNFKAISMFRELVLFLQNNLGDSNFSMTEWFYFGLTSHLSKINKKGA